MVKCTNCIDYLSEPKEKYAGLCQRCYVAGVHDFQSRITSLEAERERLREMVIKFVDNCLRDEKECPYCREATALVGGEVKNG